MVNLGSKRVVWEYVGGQPGARGPDGRHWLVVRGIAGQESGRLASIDSPDPSLEKAEALMADPNASAMLRPGYKVSVQLNLNGPPKDPQGFRQGLTEAIAAKLKQNGLTVVDDGAPVTRPNSTRVSYIPATSTRRAGPDARLVVNVREKDTGKTITYQGIGRRPRERPGREARGPGLRDDPGQRQGGRLVDAPVYDPAPAVRVRPADALGRDRPRGRTSRSSSGTKVKEWATTTGPPYFVARDGNEVVRLPGWTDLNAEFAK